MSMNSIMNENLFKEWKRQARKAGKNKRGESYYDEYEYHLSMVVNPLPFQLWKMKFDALSEIPTLKKLNPERENVLHCKCF